MPEKAKTRRKRRARREYIIIDTTPVGTPEEEAARQAREAEFIFAWHDSLPIRSEQK